MESFDSLLRKSIKTGKEFRFYVGAVLILSAAFSFLVFLACDKTFEELLQRENGMIGMMYLILGAIYAAVFFYLMCLYRNFLSANIRNSGILIAMGMPRKKLKKHLLIRTAIPVVTAVVAGAVFGYGIYDIVILNGVIHTGKTILQDISIQLLLTVILILIFICYVGMIWNHRVFNYKDILDIVNGREAKMKRSGRPKVMAAVGLVFLVVGNLFLIINKIGTKEPSNLLVLISTATVICGVYL
ncbi:MAG: FtsX-like permease family protein, partial [Lachnospiraceae bacterium]|nr:FtsX-like permease family protein [Lachnospiraceae bacterium]